jgi:hypothetical protein
VLRVVLVAALAGLVLAGCGVRTTKPFTAAGTAPCLRDKGFTQVTTSFTKVGFVAGNAENGGLVAKPPSGNELTIAFAADEDSVASVEQAFRRFAPPKLRPHIGDIMSSVRNAVLVWTITPDPDESDTATRCLKP